MSSRAGDIETRAPGASSDRPELDGDGGDVLEPAAYEQLVEALSGCNEDPHSQAVCRGVLDPDLVVRWTDRTQRLVRYKFDADELRVELPAIARTLHELLQRVDLPPHLDRTSATREFMAALPGIRRLVALDVVAAFEGDPAAQGATEIVLAYPAIRALSIHRIAHVLYDLGVPLLPRIMSEYAHDRTGIDIHPGARIGERCFIDHGTGVVIGETTLIGKGVRIYQGVTLGAASLRNASSLRGVKRHPTVEDGVTIYAGATILGGDTVIGAGHSTQIIGEIGINHNGNPDNAQELISGIAKAGGLMAKFQMRTVQEVYSPEELAQERESPFGTTNGDLKHALEFDQDDYDAIDAMCKVAGIIWTASPWDLKSVELLRRYSPPCVKIASAMLTNVELLQACRSLEVPIILSTGLSTMEQVRKAVQVLGKQDLILMHCVGVYPCPDSDLNLRCIQTLQQEFGVPVGYSGHEQGLATTLAAVALGACIVERHITLDRTMFGSDQKASLELDEFRQLVDGVRSVESSLGDGIKRVLPEELPVIKKLRQVDTLGV